jgi:hypothetical protein
MQISAIALGATDTASRQIRSDDIWEWWGKLTETERRSVLRGLNVAQRRELARRWYGFENDGQREPGSDWRIWLIQAGRGFGKTRAGAEWVSQVARDLPGARIALVAATMADGQRVMIEGPSGLIAVARDHEPVRWMRERRELRFANGAVAMLYSAEAGEELRGPEHHVAWCDELAKWRRGEAAWDNLMMGLRLGEAPAARSPPHRPCNICPSSTRSAGVTAASPCVTTASPTPSRVNPSGRSRRQCQNRQASSPSANRPSAARSTSANSGPSSVSAATSAAKLGRST